MNDPLVADAELRASPPSPPPAPRPARRWPLWLLGGLLLAAMAAVAVVWIALSALNPVPLNVVIDGERVLEGVDLASMPPAHKVVLATVVVVSVLAALVVVPFALLFALLGVLAAIVTVVGLPVLAALVVLALVLSPLWLLGWLIWKAVS